MSDGTIEATRAQSTIEALLRENRTFVHRQTSTIRRYTKSLRTIQRRSGLALPASWSGSSRGKKCYSGTLPTHSGSSAVN